MSDRGFLKTGLMRERKYRLLFISPSAYPLGGVADWLDYLLPGLERLGHEAILGLVEGAVHLYTKPPGVTDGG